MADTREPLRCPRCGEQVSVVERVLGHLDWGKAFLDDKGAVIPEVAADDVPTVMADNSTPQGVWAHCDNEACQYEWKLRRRFKPWLTRRTRPAG